MKASVNDPVTVDSQTIPQALELPETISEPSGGWLSLELGDLWRFHKFEPKEDVA